MLKVERLERRRLFAVSVVEGYPGFYEVHGDANANVLDISVDMDNLTFTLGGTTYPNVERVAVFGYGGDDSISVLTNGFGYIGASISGGDGDDVMSLNFDGAIWGGAGSDTINLLNSFRGEAYGDGGNDEIIVSGDTVDAEIRGGSGNDLIDARNNNVGVVIYGELGDDTIFGSAYDDRIYGGEGTDVVYGMAGDDSLFSSEEIHGGDGNDILYMSSGTTTYDGIEQIIS